MSTETFFKACQDGDVEQLRGLLEGDANFDVNVKDVHGMTALAYGARNGHVEIVRELLSRGATKTDLLEQGYGLNNPDIASLLGVGEQAQQQQQPLDGNSEEFAAMPIDIHGGQQMPDGTISYMNASSNFGQGFQMMPAFLGSPYPPQFYPEGMHAPHATFQPGMGRRGHPTHGRKESTVNLPPPEVARMIPCKYFPNCKYGDKCVFAHPPIGMPAPLPPQGHPLSPSMSHPPPMQAMFYQQLPPGYPYLPYGNAPQQFIPMGPPTPLQQHQQQHQQPYGAPQQFGQPSVQSQPQDVQPASQQAEVPIESEGGEANPSSQDAATVSQQDANVTVQASLPQHADASQSSSGLNEQPAQTAATPTTDSTHVQAASSKEGEVEQQSSDATASSQNQVSEQESNGVASKPVHRRQSFNSFLHHHAVPFQPQSASTGADGNTQLTNGHTFAPRNTQGGKGRRVGGAAGGGAGANGFPNAKRSSHSGERPPCTFFQAGRCRYGDECRFPHILIDGTDARPIQAQQRQIAAAQVAAANGAPTSSRSVNANSAPASAPTGPQADKRAQQQHALPQQPQHQQQKEQSQQQGSISSQPTPSQAQERQQSSQKGGKGNSSNGVVRSNPSKTTQAAAAAAKGSGGKKQNNQNQQQGQQQHHHSQRVPTVNDFPALSSPNPNGSSSTSPLPTPSTVIPNGINGSSASAHNGASTSVPKVNFSAILSAPAPAKPKPTPADTTSSGHNGVTENNSEENGAPVDGAAANATESTSSKTEGVTSDGKTAVQPVKTHATAAAAAAAGIHAANGITPTSAATVAAAGGKPQQAKVNGSNKEKPRTLPNGTGHKDGSKASATTSPVSYKAAAAAPAPPKPALNGTATAESEDDFQLVNRSRSANKRPSQGGSASGKSNGDGYAPQVKAVVA